MFVNSVYTDAFNYPDLHLQTSSPAYGGGSAISGYTVDIEGNAVPSSSPDIGAYQHYVGTTDQNVRLSVKILLEGASSSGSMSTLLNSSKVISLTQPYSAPPWSYSGSESVTQIPSAVVDWVLVELRSSTAAASVVQKKAALLLSNGAVVDVDGISSLNFKGVSSGSYYIVVRQRNHLAVMSSVAVALTSTAVTYDFTNALSKYYGTDPAADLGNGLFGLYTGDADANGVVNILDYGPVNSAFNQSGYKQGDLNLDGTVNSKDNEIVKMRIFKNSKVP
jgi:hypothetical protein